MAHDVDGRVYEQHSAYGYGEHLEEVWEWVECVVVDGVALGPICSWTDKLHDIVRCVKRGDLHEELEDLVRDRAWGVRIDIEGLGGTCPSETVEVEEEVDGVDEDVRYCQRSFLRVFFC